jgi:hypothetical protein
MQRAENTRRVSALLDFRIFLKWVKCYFNP